MSLPPLPSSVRGGALVLALGLTSAVAAQTRSSANYTHSTEVLDSAGQRVTSASYVHEGDLNMLGRSVGSGAFALTLGFLGTLPPAAGGTPPSFLSGTSVVFTIGSAGSFTVAADGSPAPTLALSSGTLPANVTFAPASGLLSGVPAAGTQGNYALTFTATNGVAPDATQAFNLRVNRAPVGGTSTLGTVPNTPASINVAKLRAVSSDPDGDAISVSAVSATSAQGGTVMLGPSTVVYVPPANYAGPDSFTFTVTDGFPGSSGSGTVNVSVRPGNAISLNVVSITPGPTGIEVVCAGIPGFNYVVQYTDSLSSPWTHLTAAQPAGADGRFVALDATVPLPPQRFYRVVSGP
ncbi:MAG: cadherin-like domain-containing protein [Verrucomicrobia bacterium]|nr:cadherin-like domain-containing protein [Verrucomicrobiota bacterium]